MIKLPGLCSEEEQRGILVIAADRTEKGSLDDKIKPYATAFWQGVQNNYTDTIKPQILLLKAMQYARAQTNTWSGIRAQELSETEVRFYNALSDNITQSVQLVGDIAGQAHLKYRRRNTQVPSENQFDMNF